MAKCWTCGAVVDTPTYTCGVCENSSTLAVLRQGVDASGEDAGEALSRLEAQAVEELRHSTTTLSRVSSVSPEWRTVMTRMLETRGVIGLTTAVRWGFGELSWRAHQASDVLGSIDDTLRTPSATQADEWRRMAEELRRRGVLDESEEFYSKALEQNRLDYRIYVGLAETYIRASRFEDAKAMLQRSIPHAPTDDIDYRSHSFRLLGHIFECEGDYAGALEALSSAVELSPGYVEARYDHAQYAARTGAAETALAALAEVVRERPSYWYLANVEPNFDDVRADVDDLLAKLLSDARENAAEAVSSAEQVLIAARLDVDVAETEERPGAAVARELLTRALEVAERARTESVSDDYLTVLGAAQTAAEAEMYAVNASQAAQSETPLPSAGDVSGADAVEPGVNEPASASEPTESERGSEECDVEDEMATVAAVSSEPEPVAITMDATPSAAAPAAPVRPAATPEQESTVFSAAMTSGVKTAAVFTPLAAFALAVAGFMHGSMIMSIENLDAPFRITWTYLAAGTPTAFIASFGLGALRGRLRALRMLENTPCEPVRTSAESAA